MIRKNFRKVRKLIGIDAIKEILAILRDTRKKAIAIMLEIGSSKK